MINKLTYFIPALLFLLAFSGCEKEIGDLTSPPVQNPFEGNYRFNVWGQLSGSSEITINNRGNFSFFVVVRYSEGGPAFSVVATGSIDEAGNLEGTLYRSQVEVGSMNGILGVGNFIVNEGTTTYSAFYGSTLIE